MKKLTGFTAVLLAAILLLTSLSIGVVAEETEDVTSEPAFVVTGESLTDDSAYNYVPGDVNNDGFIYADDARTVLRISVGLESWDYVAGFCYYPDFYDYKSAADADGDGFITAADARLILRIAVKLEPMSAARESAFSTKEKIIDFYTRAVNNVKFGGVAGYDRKSYQELKSCDVLTIANDSFKNEVSKYLTSASAAKSVCYARGTNEARYYFPNFTIGDHSKVKSANCTVTTTGNYMITLTMIDADTTSSGNDSFLYKLTDDAICWDTKVEPVLEKMISVKNWWDPSIITKEFSISAEITPDGRFLSAAYTGLANITVGKLQMTLNPLCPYENKTAVVKTTSLFSNFSYSSCFRNCRYEIPAAFGSITQIADYIGARTLEIAERAKAGYTKVAYQTMTDDYNLSVCTKNSVKDYLTSKTNATPVTTVKGSTESWALFPPFSLKRYDNIESAVCAVQPNGNYLFSIVFKDVDTSKSGSYNDLQLVTTNLLSFDKSVAPALRDMCGVVSYSGGTVTYQDFTINAEVTPDGKLVNYSQTAKVRCAADYIRILLISHKNQYVVLNSVQEYTNFTY